MQDSSIDTRDLVGNCAHIDVEEISHIQLGPKLRLAPRKHTREVPPSEQEDQKWG